MDRALLDYVDRWKDYPDPDSTSLDISDEQSFIRTLQEVIIKFFFRLCRKLQGWQPMTQSKTLTRLISWMIGHSGEDGRYVNSPEKRGGVAFKDEWGASERHRYFNDRESC